MASVFTRDANLAVLIDEMAPPVLTVGRFTTVATRSDALAGDQRERWLNGVNFRPWPRTLYLTASIIAELDCDDDTPSTLDLANNTCVRQTYFFCPNRFETVAVNSTLASADADDNLAVQQLRQLESYNLARVLESGGDEPDAACGGGLAAYAEDSQQLTATTGIPMVQALAILEQSIALTTTGPSEIGSANRRHTIVMSLQAQTYLVAAGELTYNAELDAYVTASGNVVLADAGVVGLIEGTAVAGIEPLYIVPEIFYHLTEPRHVRRSVLDPSALGEDAASGGDRNQVSDVAQQWAIVMFDGGAVRAAYGTYEV